MSNRSSIPHDLERTPDQPGDGGINDLPTHREHDCIKRAEFDSLCLDVKQIKYAIIGKNPMNPDPTALVPRVDDHDGRLKTLENHTKESRWGYRAAIAGVISIGIHRLFGGH